MEKELFHNITLKRKKYFEKLLLDYELYIIDLEVLYFIYLNPSINTFSSLLASKEYTKSHLSTAINRLIEKQYLSKELSSTNKKVYYLKLEDKSKKIIDEYEICSKKFKSVCHKNITKEEYDAYLAVLIKISQNLSNEGEVE